MKLAKDFGYRLTFWMKVLMAHSANRLNNDIIRRCISEWMMIFTSWLITDNTYQRCSFRELSPVNSPTNKSTCSYSFRILFNPVSLILPNFFRMCFNPIFMLSRTTHTILSHVSTDTLLDVFSWPFSCLRMNNIATSSRAISGFIPTRIRPCCRLFEGCPASFT